MLDNPNLNMEKMLEVVALGMDIIGYALIFIVVLLIYLYRYEIKLFFKYGLSDDSIAVKFLKIIGVRKTDFSTLEKKDLNNKVDTMLDKFNKSALDFDTDLLEDDVLAEKSNNPLPPNFRSLKTIRKSNTIMYHFVNEGGAIHDFSINNSEEVGIFFNFESRIEAKASGYIKFELPKNIKKNDFNFTLVYYDEVNNRHQIIFTYSLSTNKLRSTD